MSTSPPDTLGGVLDFVPYSQKPQWPTFLRLSDKARLVLDFLWAHVNSNGAMEAHPSVPTVASFFGNDVTWARKAVAELEQHGVLARVPTYYDRQANERTLSATREDGTYNAQSSNTLMLRWNPPEGLLHPLPLNTGEYYHPERIAERIRQQEALQQAPRFTRTAPPGSHELPK